jgi:CHAT domain
LVLAEKNCIRSRDCVAANVAEQLIEIGVRCVVAAGWAVDDDPAMLFATTFYQALMRGRTFAEAVGYAREETLASYPGSNTWGRLSVLRRPGLALRRRRRRRARKLLEQLHDYATK